jgi:ABC-type molybdate transport system substrate-binding protein
MASSSSTRTQDSRAHEGLSIPYCASPRDYRAFGDEPALGLHAAGSLRAVMTGLTQAFTASGGPRVESTFGASGLLRERIEKGEPTDVFASSDVGNAQLLADAGRAAPPIVFARNQLCVLLAPGVDVTAGNLLDRMLDPAVKLDTSTPKAARPATTHGSSSRRRTSYVLARTPCSTRRRSS